MAKSFKRYTTAVTKFSGVDYSSQRFNVASSRAIDLLNYIYKDGVIQKRLGCRQVYPSTAISYYDLNNQSKNNTLNVNGIWKFKAEDGNEHIVAHIGKLLCEVKFNSDITISVEPIAVGTYSNMPKCIEFEDFVSNAFVGANKLYFLGGNKFVALRFYEEEGSIKRELYEIEDDARTFVPTTTISITAQGTGVSGQTAYDRVNLMTQWHKNTLLTGAKLDESLTDGLYSFVLDQPLICKSSNNSEMEDFKIVLKERGFYI